MLTPWLLTGLLCVSPELRFVREHVELTVIDRGFEVTGDYGFTRLGAQEPMSLPPVQQGGDEVNKRLPGNVVQEIKPGVAYYAEKTALAQCTKMTVEAAK